MPSAIIALVTIRYQWVRLAGLDQLLVRLAENRNPSLTGTLVLPLTRYDTSDSAFVELGFSSPALELEGTLFVPKSEVIAIVRTVDPEHLHRVGYRPNTYGEVLEPTPAETPAVEPLPTQ
jgi:hypothetical protein